MEDYRLEQSGQEVQDILNGAAMQSDLTAETERAELAEQTLQGKIDDEETRAKAAEKQNADDIGALKEKVPSGASSSNKLATEEYVDNSVSTKQDTLTFDNVPTEGSNNPVKSSGVYSADKALSDAIEAILLLIPSAATSLNKLADKAFVNSSIATASATFRGTYNLVTDLSLTVSATHAQIATALAGAVADEDNNDYAFVQIPTSDATPTQIAKTERYKFNGTAWEYEYDLNNSGYTAAQWAAINSGITEALVTKLSALPTNADLTTALGVLTSSITTINQKIPSAASQANQLVDTAAMEAYIVQVLDVLTASFSVTSSDGHVTVSISQVDGKIASVSVSTSDIASAASLSLIAGRVTTAEGNISTNAADIANLQDAYAALTQSALLVVQPTDTWPVASPATSTIYRVVDRTNTPPQYYSDYMWNGTAMVLMATYDNAIDDVPTPGSNNLVKSGGVYNELALGAVYDVSAKNPTAGPNNDGKWESISALLSDANLSTLIPTSVRKGGMSIKFVQSSDNKYVQYRLMATSWSTNIDDWIGLKAIVDYQLILKKHDDGFLNKNGTWTNANGFISGYTDIIDCSVGDKFLYYGFGSGTSPIPEIVETNGTGVSWIFYNSQEQIISAYRVGQLNLYEVEIPDGVSKVRFSGLISTQNDKYGLDIRNIKSIVGKNYENIKEINEDIDFILQSSKENDGTIQGYINSSDGKLITNSSLDAYVVRYLVQAGDKIKIFSRPNENIVNNFAFYNIGANLSIDGCHTYTVGLSDEITVPGGATVICIQYRWDGKGNINDVSLYNAETFIARYVLPAYSSIINIETDISEINETSDKFITRKHENGFLNKNGTWTNANGFISGYTDIIDCSVGDKFLYYGFGSGNSSEAIPEIVTNNGTGVSWIFFDNQNQIIAAYRAPKFDIYEVEIPEGVSKIMFAGLISTQNAKYIFGAYKDSVIKKLAEDIAEPGEQIKNKWKGIKWTAIGDSLTEHNLRASENYLDYIHDWTNITIVNCGHSGCGYKENYSTNGAFYQRVQTEIPADSDIITIFGSGNDIHYDGSSMKYQLGQVTDTGVETICGCINTTIDYIQTHYPLVPFGIITPTPWYVETGMGNQTPLVPGCDMELYTEAIVEICRRRGIPVLDLYHCSGLHPESADFRDVAYRRDGTYTASQQGVTGAILVTQDNIEIVKEFGVPNAQLGDYVLPNLNGVHPDENGHLLIAPRIKAFLETMIER